MSRRDGEADADSVSALLRAVIPGPTESTAEFVTRIELQLALQHVETKIVNSELKMRNWVLLGCLTIILAFGSGYVSLVGKIDRLSEAMPLVDQVLDGRRSWMLRKDQTDQQQDSAIERVAPDYKPPPYVEPPR